VQGLQLLGVASVDGVQVLSGLPAHAGVVAHRCQQEQLPVENNLHDAADGCDQQG
jgi:hypothetical protein